jgi:hypothetical protein
MVLEPSAEQVGAIEDVVGIAGVPVAAALLNDTLGPESQFPLFYMSV